MKFSVLVAGSDTPLLTRLSSFFTEKQIHAMPAETFDQALSEIKKNRFDLMITDETLKEKTGKQLIEAVTAINPLINCVAVSALDEDSFHEAFEGLGVLMRLDPDAGEDEFEKMISTAETIIRLNRVE